MADLFTRSKPPDAPLPGKDYLLILHKYLRTNLPRLAPSAPPPPSVLQQSYTLLTLGLDPSSQPLSRSLKVPLTLGFGSPSAPKGPIRPLTLRLPPDRLLYLLLRWQALPQNLAHVGRTDVPVEDGVPFTARGAAEREGRGTDGDVQSVRSWVGSMRSVSVGSMGMGMVTGGMKGWWGKEEPNEDQILLALYSWFNVLPALLIHPPFFSDPPIAELIEAGGYTQLGGVDVRVPLDVLRNLQVLELEAYDPRALLIPPSLTMRSLTVRDVQDGDDWIEELLTVPSSSPAVSSNPGLSAESASTPPPPAPRFPHLRHLSLPSTSLLALPSLPLTHLSSLDLSHNLLNAIPSSLSSLPSLASLNLSYNLITSVRNAPLALVGPTTTLNISHNRIDCLVGLDRCPSLQRVDVRYNDLVEVGEVGRLAVLPKVKEVWVAGNEFTSPNAPAVGGVGGGGGGDGWRVELGVMFAQEGREVIVDDTAFSWNEKRSIDAALAASGRGRPVAGSGHRKNPTAPAGMASPLIGSTSVVASKPPQSRPNGSVSATPTLSHRPSNLGHEEAETEAGPSRPRSKPASGQPSPLTAPASPTPSSATGATGAAGAGAGAGQGKKRRPRRLINLDSTDDPAEIRGGSMRLPPKSVLYEEEEGPGTGTGTGTGVKGKIATGEAGAGLGDGAESDLKDGQEGEEVAGAAKVTVVKKNRRARVSASMFEPS
ncbi:uncharacterized protein MKK02DRAFT_39544 [Dioszegia hungarica]|uniref:L domain-like protein n=1 Tax=Dioszegia hungarica TaxID=4972 RepID=A0AA38HCX0_9TREE|nr:uncharacterized protein MKK02DRAFT_39544 [Dioszegia hungarica]KAI9639248.1 hypothetical protein MKK02DRAFT_39544 [Dioszegia hungarica]